ncbi:MAG: glycosyltransferase family 4 protein [Candidatus Omnitrophica bacterium]|nr:glycosyltransferase family 4 protein [Candidatus Omnitrophota bacterium]
MKRPLVVSSKFPPEYAGSGLRAHRTYRRLAAKYGIRYKVLCSSVAFNKTGYYDFEDVSVYRIACKMFKDIEYAENITREPFLKRMVRKFKNGVNYTAEAALTWLYLMRHKSEFDLIHIFGNNYVTAAVLTYAKIRDIPVILEICNVSKRYIQYEPGIVGMIFGRGLPRRLKAVCISKRIRDVFKESGYSQETWCRPNPIDTSRFFADSRKKHDVRKRLGLFADNDIVLINVGKMCPLKNQLFLLDVLRGLPERYKLFIGGPLVDSGPYTKEDNDYFDSIKKMTRDHGLDGRVKIEKSFISNTDEYMKASDVYLLPSRIEACATPILEAIACGVPVVAHRIEGVTTEWIEEGQNGYLSELDAQLFGRKIEMAASLNKERLESSGDRIRETASTDSIDRRYIEMIEELLVDRASPPPRSQCPAS